MIRIAVTPPAILDCEPDIITAILDHGWDYLHLRHPDASLSDIRRIIEAVPPRLHSRLKLHGHFSLLSEFNLGGLHLNRRCPQPPDFYSGPLSASCHSIADVLKCTHMQYVTLSPVFPSISKPGYRSEASFDLSQLPAGTPPVIALGGIDAVSSRQIPCLGYAGYAVLGALTLGATPDNIISRLQQFDN